ncbi:DMT family transporter [Hoeflea sp. WL0058]|uniref:DMT family transporter n=1 Tax=Flavimaribacter sediminis TaxID=2865987 RepID=A0AAE3CZB7_9HYPH|nr:DMT family transporter [Flavimaribacter sediminis]MBW8635737.1 DMT family transporter [Flavimaribacter sediminis]
MQNRLTLSTWLMLVTLGLIWGASFFFARIAVVWIPPLTLVFLRVVLAAIALHLYLHGRNGLFRILAARWRSFLVLGAINNVIPFSLIFMGQTQIGAGLAAILNATTPLWTLIIANVVTEDEKMTTTRTLGCILGLVGMLVLTGPSALSGFDAHIWAQLAVVGAAISYGFAATFAKSFRGVAPTIVATGQLSASSLIMIPLICIIDQPWTLAFPPIEVVGAVILLAVLSTSVAYILYFRIIADAGATNGSLVTLLVPPSAILLGVLFLGETLTIHAALGLALIAAGLLVIDGRLLHRRRFHA